jgi:hypothetical protein
MSFTILTAFALITTGALILWLIFHLAVMNGNMILATKKSRLWFYSLFLLSMSGNIGMEYHLHGSAHPLAWISVGVGIASLVYAFNPQNNPEVRTRTGNVESTTVNKLSTKHLR